MDLDEKVIEVSKAREMMDYYGQFKLKPLQLKFLDLVIAATDPKADSLEKLILPTDVLCWNLGMITRKASTTTPQHMNKKVKDLAMSLMGKNVFETAKGVRITQLPWFTTIQILYDTNEVEITLSDQLKEFLLINQSMGHKFHKYHFSTINYLTQRESILLYMLLNSVYVCDKGTATYSIEELQQKLCIVPNPEYHALNKKNNKHQYSDQLGNTIGTSMLCTRNFKRLVIGKAIDDINTHTNILVKAVMTPIEQPDTKKTHVVFEVSDNPNFKGTRPQSKTKKSGFVTGDEAHIQELNDQAISELQKRKDLIINLFGDEATDYIAIIDEYYPEQKSLAEVCLRCEWLVAIKEFEQKHGSKTLKSLIMIDYISAGLFNRAMAKKPDRHVKGETTKVRNFQVKKNHISTTQNTKVIQNINFRESNESIASTILAKILNSYKIINETRWPDKCNSFEKLIETSAQVTESSITQVKLIKELFKDTGQFTWCIFSTEKIETKESYILTITQIQQDLITNYNFTGQEATENSKLIKEILDNLLMLPIDKVARKASSLDGL